MSRDDRLALAWTGIHPDRLRRLVQERGNAGRVLRGIRRGTIEVSDWVARRARLDVDSMRRELTTCEAEAIYREDAGYVASLREIPDAPDVLFVQGALTDVPAVAVVGTRRCTAYGRNLARALGVAVAEAGWVLVSGLARGIDGAAHAGTVAAGGIGVAVLGCGLDRSYPREHDDLRRSLIESGGAVVSEYPPGATPEPWRFPPRNRIIAAMTAAVIVVEAGTRGGALITAHRALDYGRPVFAVPGDITRPTSVGCNLLIRDGAHPVLGPDDLVEGLSLILGPPKTRAGSGHCETSGHALSRWMRADGSTVDELAREAGMGVGEILGAVAELEAQGAISIVDGLIVPARIA